MERVRKRRISVVTRTGKRYTIIECIAECGPGNPLDNNAAERGAPYYELSSGKSIALDRSGHWVHPSTREVLRREIQTRGTREPVNQKL
jgi:hypothetical protein